MITYYIAIGVSGIVRGAYIATLAWTSMLLGGNIATVGAIFLIGHIVNVVFGPFVGLFIDSKSRKGLAVSGHLINAVATVIPPCTMLLSFSLSIWVLALVATLSAFGVLTMTGSLEAIQQSLANREGKSQSRISAVSGGVRQGAMVVGTGSAGLGIHYLSPEITFGVISGLCLIASVFILYIPSNGKLTRTNQSIFEGIRSGYRELLEHPEVFRLTLLIALGFSVGQMSNVLLPNLVKDGVGGDSRLFAVLDGLWSSGGVAAAFAAAAILRKYVLNKMEYLAGILMGIVMLAVSVTDNELLLMIEYFLLGVTFSLLKVLADGRIFTICPEHLIGRVRTHVQSMISAVGIFVYLSPVLIRVESPRGAYLAWGVVVAFLPLFLLLKKGSSNFNEIKTK